ncbi:Uncharacterized protein TCM_042469 [Theobroma cacao]|uniref:Uncharacterized protein n=1 Tax=Theobroma cacao TaxID=3641 RepID=A0A061FLG3_THECC|nr:Uncharacterized protein TCM_042469 [Theobroma cacao]
MTIPQKKKTIKKRKGKMMSSHEMFCLSQRRTVPCHACCLYTIPIADDHPVCLSKEKKTGGGIIMRYGLISPF